MFDSTYIGYYYLLARAFLPPPEYMEYEEKLIRLLIVDEGYHRAEQITSSLRATGMQVRAEFAEDSEDMGDLLGDLMDGPEGPGGPGGYSRDPGLYDY